MENNIEFGEIWAMSATSIAEKKDKTYGGRGIEVARANVRSESEDDEEERHERRPRQRPPDRLHVDNVSDGGSRRRRPERKIQNLTARQEFLDKIDLEAADTTK